MFIITCNNGSVSSDIIICQFSSCDGVLCTTYPFAGMLFLIRSYAINVEQEIAPLEYMHGCVVVAVSSMKRCQTHKLLSAEHATSKVIIAPGNRGPKGHHGCTCAGGRTTPANQHLPVRPGRLCAGICGAKPLLLSLPSPNRTSLTLFRGLGSWASSHNTAIKLLHSSHGYALGLPAPARPATPI